MRILQRALLFAWLLVLAGCATLQTDFEKPTVSVTSFRALPSDGMVPRFEIGLHVINPNRTALDIEGMTYSVALEGRRLLNGVANDLPVVPAYGEADIRVLTTADLLSGFRLLADLMRTQRDTVSYELNARLDLGRFLPYVDIVESGEVSLTGGR
ncbi:LEA type 2 family protein [Marinobacterium aestuariivivens]|uniref:LEA type 2 family protein n=1 Tax=Marinobacterium aestuariivivens TaxID=1698799 RepID=A0ABW2A2V7_9GAMM